MKRYIDAEKLIAEIERRIENWTIRGKHSPAGQGRDTCDSRVAELSDLLPFITSLQQEQLEADGDDGKFVKILVRKEFAEQFKKLGDEIQAGQSSFIGALNQPEVDLEKEFNDFLDNIEGVPRMWHSDEQIEWAKDIARHFAEWGAIHLNAIKEENK